MKEQKGFDYINQQKKPPKKINVILKEKEIKQCRNCQFLTYVQGRAFCKVRGEFVIFTMVMNSPLCEYYSRKG